MGGAVGGAVLIAVLCILGYLYRRRTISDGSEKQDGPDLIIPQPIITPFTEYRGSYSSVPSQPNPGYVDYRYDEPSTGSNAVVEQGKAIHWVLGFGVILNRTRSSSCATPERLSNSSHVDNAWDT